MHAFIKNLLVVALFAFSSAAVAEPWCLVRDTKENCRYYTAEECYRDSNRGGGYCKPNPRELGVKGNAPYCVISAGSKVCKYRSRGRCLSDARRISGGCVRNTELDLARRAVGEQRAQGCLSLEEEGCGTSFEDFGSASLEAAGYEPPSTEAVDILE